MKNLPISMLKWGKTALQGSKWKHRHSFSTSELEYKFDRNLYRKMDNSFDMETKTGTDDNFIFKTNDNDNLNNKEKWLSTSISSNDSFSSISINSNGNDVSIQSEPIMEKDALEWKKYVQYEIKDNNYMNLNIIDLLKEYIDKNKNKNNSSKVLSNDMYKNKTINLCNTNKNPTYNKIVDIKPMMPSSINNYNSNYSYSDSSNSMKSNKKSLSSIYDIQTIEYNLKYNSNYDVENIPKEVIMELLNNQLHSKDTDESSTSNSNRSPRGSPTSAIPSSFEKSSSLKNYDTDTLSKEDNRSFISELTANTPQTISSDRPENNWNSLYVINEMRDLSIYSNSPEYYSNANNTNSTNNPFDYSNYSASADYHQFYLDNRPKSINKKQKKGIKNAIRVSYKHIRNSMKLKQRRASTSTIETGNTTFYSMDENESTSGFSDIISFNDALNLPIERNSK